MGNIEKDIITIFTRAAQADIFSQGRLDVRILSTDNQAVVATRSIPLPIPRDLGVTILLNGGNFLTVEAVGLRGFECEPLRSSINLRVGFAYRLAVENADAALGIVQRDLAALCDARPCAAAASITTATAATQAKRASRTKHRCDKHRQRCPNVSVTVPLDTRQHARLVITEEIRFETPPCPTACNAAGGCAHAALQLTNCPGTEACIGTFSTFDSVTVVSPVKVLERGLVEIRVIGPLFGFEQNPLGSNAFRAFNFHGTPVPSVSPTARVVNTVVEQVPEQDRQIVTLTVEIKDLFGTVRRNLEFEFLVC